MSEPSTADISETIGLCNQPHTNHLADPNIIQAAEWFKDPDGFSLLCLKGSLDAHETSKLSAHLLSSVY